MGTLQVEHLLVGALIAVLALGLLGALGILHYVVRRNRKALEAKVNLLESLSAALGLLLLEALDILAQSQPPAGQVRVGELKQSVHKVFEDYHLGGIVLQAMRDLNIGRDVVGRDKAET